MAPCRGQSDCCLERFNQVDEPVYAGKYRAEKYAFRLQPFPEKTSHAVSLFAEPDRSRYRLVALVVVPLQVNGTAGVGPDRNGCPDCTRIDNEVEIVSETAKKKCLSAAHATMGIRCHGHSAHHWSPDRRLAVGKRSFVKIVSMARYET